MPNFIPESVNKVNLSIQAGFEYVWYPHDTFMQNTWVITAAVSEHTSRIKIGSVGTNPYTTSPAEIATYIATLDANNIFPQDCWRPDSAVVLTHSIDDDTVQFQTTIS